MTLCPAYHASTRIFLSALVLLALTAIQIGGAPAAEAQTVEICQDGCEFLSIQAALDAARPGAVVRIGPGAYYESIRLRPSVTLRGAGIGATVLHGDGTQPVISASGGEIRRDTLVEALSVTGGGGEFGAGILIRQNAAPTFRTVSIYRNTASRQGGGLSILSQGDVLLEDVHIRDNQAPSGSGLSATSARVTVRNSSFVNNLTVGQDGAGALYITSASELIMENSTVMGTTAALGGGLRLSADSSGVITGGRFENNAATSSGGGVQANGNVTLTLEGVAFIDNRAGQGGAVSIEGSNLVVNNCLFERNRAFNSGGAVRAAHGETAVIRASRFVGNVAETIHGGAIYLINIASEARDNLFQDNQAAGWGGAMALITPTNNALVVNNVVVDNQASSGGGITVDRGQARIIRNTVSNNQAHSFGGGILIIAVPNILVRRNTIDHNVAGVDGGGLVMQRETNGVVEGNIISFNQANELAGGFKIFDRTSPIVRNNRFEANTAGRTGGGIHVEEQSHPLVENNDFISNTAVRYGGAAVAHLSSNPVLRYNTFVGNRADLGGGALYIHENCQVRVEHNTFSDNWGGSTGGALFAANDDNSQIVENYFIRNSSDDRGGAVFIRDTSLELNGNQIVANSAQGYGGGLAAVGEGHPKILNNLIANNHAGGDGDGVYLRADVIFRNNTVARNDRNKEGDGIFLSDSPGSSLLNNLVIGNDRGVRGSQPAQLARNCFFDNRQANYDGILPGPDDFTSDPMLTKGALGSYYLSHAAAGQGGTSPLVDAVDQSAQALGLAQSTTRTDGRPDQGLADIGFHYPSLPARSQFLPLVALSN